jgi:hypothetical protein
MRGGARMTLPAAVCASRDEVRTVAPKQVFEEEKV